MSFIPKLKITNIQNRNLVEYRDITGYYGYSNPTGYGVLNPDYINITNAKLDINDTTINLLYNTPIHSISDLVYSTIGSYEDNIYSAVYTVVAGATYAHSYNIYIYDRLLEEYYKISNLIGEVYRTEYPLTTKVKNLVESYFDLELLINRLISFASEDNKADYIELYDKCKRIILAIDRTLK